MWLLMRWKMQKNCCNWTNKSKVESSTFILSKLSTNFSKKPKWHRSLMVPLLFCQKLVSSKGQTQGSTSCYRMLLAMLPLSETIQLLSKLLKGISWRALLQICKSYMLEHSSRELVKSQERVVRTNLVLLSTRKLEIWSCSMTNLK